MCKLAVIPKYNYHTVFGLVESRCIISEILTKVIQEAYFFLVCQTVVEKDLAVQLFTFMLCQIVTSILPGRNVAPVCIWMPKCQAGANRFCLLLLVLGALGEWLLF